MQARFQPRSDFKRNPGRLSMCGDLCRLCQRHPTLCTWHPGAHPIRWAGGRRSVPGRPEKHRCQLLEQAACVLVLLRCPPGVSAKHDQAWQPLRARASILTAKETSIRAQVLLEQQQPEHSVHEHDCAHPMQQICTSPFMMCGQRHGSFQRRPRRTSQREDAIVIQLCLLATL